MLQRCSTIARTPTLCVAVLLKPEQCHTLLQKGAKPCTVTSALHLGEIARPGCLHSSELTLTGCFSVRTLNAQSQSTFQSYCRCQQVVSRCILLDLAASEAHTNSSRKICHQAKIENCKHNAIVFACAAHIQHIVKTTYLNSSIMFAGLCAELSRLYYLFHLTPHPPRAPRMLMKTKPAPATPRYTAFVTALLGYEVNGLRLLHALS